MATVATATADIVDGALANVSDTGCTLGLSTYGSGSVFSVLLDSVIDAATATITVVVDSPADDYEVIWLNAIGFVVKPLAGTVPTLPSSVSITVADAN